MSSAPAGAVAGPAWREAGSLSELRRQGHLIARLAGRQIGVVLDPLTSQPHALRDRCPHHGGPLCEGRVVTRQTGSPGNYELGNSSSLRCPWHGWEFDMNSGSCLDDTALRVAVYPVRVEGDRVLVEV